MGVFNEGLVLIKCDLIENLSKDVDGLSAPHPVFSPFKDVLEGLAFFF